MAPREVLNINALMQGVLAVDNYQSSDDEESNNSSGDETEETNEDESSDDGLPQVIFLKVLPDIRGNLKLAMQYLLQNGEMNTFFPQRITIEESTFPIRNQKRIDYHDVIRLFLDSNALTNPGSNTRVMSNAFTMNSHFESISFDMGDMNFDFVNFDVTFIVDYCFVRMSTRRMMLRNGFFLYRFQQQMAREYPYVSVLHCRNPHLSQEENLRRTLIRISNRRGRPLLFDGYSPNL